MEKARTQARLEVLDTDWRAVGIIVNLANDPRNQRAERQRKARARQRRAVRRRKLLRTLHGINPRLCHLAFHAKRHRVRKKNMRRLLRQLAQAQGPVP